LPETDVAVPGSSEMRWHGSLPSRHAMLPSLFSLMAHRGASLSPARRRAFTASPALAAFAVAQANGRLVLGIESSCDDTGVAIVSADGRILGEALVSQEEVHAVWGGVVPKLAQEAHREAIDGCVERALASAGVGPTDLSAVAVTVGPGLSLCLGVRTSFFSSSIFLPSVESIFPLSNPKTKSTTAHCPTFIAGRRSQSASAICRPRPSPHPRTSLGGTRPDSSPAVCPRHGPCSHVPLCMPPRLRGP
jgi:hypothetical protein